MKQHATTRRVLSLTLAIMMAFSLAAIPASAEDDVTAPTILSFTTYGILDTALRLSFKVNEQGTFYYLVLAGADGAPNAETIKAQGVAVAKGTGAIYFTGSGGKFTVATATGLTASTAYKAYVIAEDAAGNVSGVSNVAFSTNAAFPDNLRATFSATSVQGNPGDTVTVCVSIDTNPGLAAWQIEALTTSLNSGVEWVSAAVYGPWSMSGAASSFFNSSYKIEYSLGESSNLTYTGKILDITLKIKDDAPAGIITIPFDFTVAKYDETCMSYISDDGTVPRATITVVRPSGDVNDDGAVNQADLARLQQFFAGWNVTIDKTTADVTGDGDVNQADLARLQQYFAGWSVTLG